MIVHSLLLQVPGISRINLDKVYRRGSVVSMRYAPRAPVTSRAIGIAEAVALDIIERFQAYRRRRAGDATRGRGPGRSRSAWKP